MKNITIKNLGKSNYEITNLENGKKITCYKQYLGMSNKNRDKHIIVFTGWSTDGFNSYSTRKELINHLLNIKSTL